MSDQPINPKLLIKITAYVWELIEIKDVCTDPTALLQ